MAKSIKPRNTEVTETTTTTTPVNRLDQVQDLIEQLQIDSLSFPRINDPYFRRRIMNIAKGWGTVVDSTESIRVLKNGTPLQVVEPNVGRALTNNWNF